MASTVNHMKFDCFLLLSENRLKLLLLLKLPRKKETIKSSQWIYLQDHTIDLISGNRFSWNNFPDYRFSLFLFHLKCSISVCLPPHIHSCFEGRLCDLLTHDVQGKSISHSADCFFIWMCIGASGICVEGWFILGISFQREWLSQLNNVH